MTQGVLYRYRDHLPVTSETPMFSLGEGGTPLVKSRAIGDMLGCDDLYFKLEGCNPTGSFKDRGMVMAVAKAVEAGAKSITCASTGNTSASAAAYGAYLDIPATVIVPKSSVSRAKLAQAIAYGARIMVIRGSFDNALDLVRELAERNPTILVNSVNPNRIQGQKTAAFEIVEDLGEAPDLVFIPVGNARKYHGLLAGLPRGVRQRVDVGASEDDGLPGSGRGPDSARRCSPGARDDSVRDQDRQSGQLERSDSRAGRVRRDDRHGLGREHP